MKRRGFIQRLLGGAAVLTAAQRTELEAQAAPPPQLPTADLSEDAVSRSGLDAQSAWSLTWREPVDELGDLPSDADEGDARWVTADDSAHVFINGTGWVMLAGTP